MSLTADVVIVGGGFAGAATAYGLARRGVKRVVLLEQERLPGSHASAVNAGMARFVVTNAEQIPLVLEGIGFLRHPPEGFPPATCFRRCGSLMLAEGDEGARLRQWLPRWRSIGTSACWIEPREVEELVPVTAGGSFDGAIYCPEDGVADVAALLDGYLRASASAGVRVSTCRRVLAVGSSGGRVASVETDVERIATPCVVDAAGAWANDLARLAGAREMPLHPRRRHLVVTSAPPGLDRAWPFVWDVSHQLYFRPEPPGLLMSPCDDGDHPPGPAPVDPDAVELLARKIERWLPRLENLSVTKAWAGLRTMTPDGCVVVGPDPELSGFVWCAGLGGNGVATSAAVGRLAACAVLGEPVPAEHSPRRWSR